MERRVFLKAIGAVGAGMLSGCLTTEKAYTALSTGPNKPNIIFILTDDQRYDAMSCMGHPFVKTPHMDRIREEGVLFKNAFVTTSLCSPARASFLTGAYAHRHGVTGNWGCEFNHDETPSFPRVLQEAGYDTAFIGKWHMKNSAQPRPGFDYWLSFKGQGKYEENDLNENGREFKSEGYVTDVLTDFAIEYIRKQAASTTSASSGQAGSGRGKPFCLYLSHKATHSPFTPAKRHEGLYQGATLPEPENAKDTLKDKPAWMRGGAADRALANGQKNVPESIEPKDFGQDSRMERWMNSLRALAAVDDGIGRVFEALEKAGELDNTVIMYASDNGYFFGEHGRGDKRYMYEESIRIPLLMRYPPAVKKNSTVEQMVLNIDVAPTILDLAGVPVPQTMQGCSLVPLLAGENAGWRKSFLYEYWMDLTPSIPRMLGVRTDDWKLVTYPDIDDIDEMYDLTKDPYEMKNLAVVPEYAAKHSELRSELDRLMKETGYGLTPLPEAPVLRMEKRKRPAKKRGKI